MFVLNSAFQKKHAWERTTPSLCARWRYISIQSFDNNWKICSQFSPNKTQNTLCRLTLMPFIGLSSILNIKVTIRGQRSPNCDFFKNFYISIARISVLNSYVVLTTKIDISCSFFPSRSDLKVKCQMMPRKWLKSTFQKLRS